MATEVGQPRTYHKKFKFVIEIDSVVSAAFHKCSPIKVDIAKVETREGGSLIPTKEPGLVTVADITLARGATDNQDLWDWFQQVANISANSGLVTPNYKRNLDIVQQDRDGTELRRWRLTNAWPISFTGGEWDNEANENTMEEVVLTYDVPDIAAKA